MLRRLQIKNFKTWPSVELDFGRITGLFGTNSSGKTSLIQFLLLLKQTKEATDRAISLDLNGPYVNLGSFQEMIHRHDESLRLSWSVDFDSSEALVIVDPSEKRTHAIARSKEITFSGQIEASSLGPVARSISYRVGENATFTLTPKKSDESAFDLKATGTDFRFIRTPGRAWQLPGPVKSYAFPDQARTYFQNASFLSDLEKAYEDQVDRIFYLGPLREYPKREYTWGKTRPRDVGVRGEKAIDAILAATVAGEQRNLKHKGRLKSFQEMIAYWLSEMGLIHDFSVGELAKGSNYWQAKVVVRKNGPTDLPPEADPFRG